MRSLLPAFAIAVATLVQLSSGITMHRDVGNLGDVSIAIRTFQFAPDTLTVKAGTRVVWSNADEIAHTITSGTPDKPDGRLSGVVAKRGATYSATLEKTGTYSYFCDRHRFMTGTVIVTR